MRANVGDGVLSADLTFVRYATAGLIMLPWLERHSPATMAGMAWCQAVVLILLAGPLFILAGASGFLFAPPSHGAVVHAQARLSVAAMPPMISSAASARRHVSGSLSSTAAAMAATTGVASWVAPTVACGSRGTTLYHTT